MPEVALIFPLIVMLAVVVFAVARRGAFRSLVIADGHLPAAVSAVHHFRRRSVLAMIVVVLFGAVLGAYLMFAIRATGPMTMMNPVHWLLLMPILTGTVGVASFSFVPHFREAGDSRSAELIRRTPFTFGPQRAFVAPSAATAILLALVFWFGVISEPDGMFWRSDRGGTIPGFFYGVPLLAGTVLIAAVTYLAVRHIASAPRPSDGALRAADATVRLLAIRIILNTVTAAVIMTVGAVLVMAGSTFESMARGTRFDGAGNLIPPDAAIQAIGVWGNVCIWAGVACFVATIVFLVSAVSDATRKPFEATRVAEVAP